MARAPFQVLVFPYRKNRSGIIEYCLFKRADNGLWQAVAGGGEDSETPLQAAIREAQEEAAIPPNEKWIKLDTVESIPAHIFTARAEWGTKTLVIPQYSFGVEMNVEVVISHEHTEFGWFDYETALQRMRYDGDKTAMWELNQRLKFGIL